MSHRRCAPLSRQGREGGDRVPSAWDPNANNGSRCGGARLPSRALPNDVESSATPARGVGQVGGALLLVRSSCRDPENRRASSWLPALALPQLRGGGEGESAEGTAEAVAAEEAEAHRDYTNRPPAVADCLANRIVQPNNYYLAVTRER